ncbi:MAG: class I SAM-dependent methyltransferase, partial [Bacteroidota bacterium]
MLITRFMRWFFHGLYHPLAFSYDWVAAAVSLGHWNDWGRMVLPYLHGGRVLELGHGPGWLQGPLRELGFQASGLDESAQMSRLAARRLRHGGQAQLNLVRGRTQALPFAAGSFDSLVSTFPSEYIFEEATL